MADALDTRITLSSENPVDRRLDALRSLIPEAFTEDQIDFDKLRSALGDAIESEHERYGLTWAGKNRAVQNTQTPSIGTLRPQKDRSINFDETENLLIEGDNLEVLKLLQKSYFNAIKMIYIDPPYNTGTDFIYPDNYRDSLASYLRYSGQVSREGVKQSTQPDKAGRHHSQWLSMMYPRLFLARNLLRADGYLVVSIDDDELTNLRHLLDEIFGAENFLTTLIWDRNRKNDAKFFSVGHEYMLVYAKNKDLLRAQDTKLRTPKEGVAEVKELFASLRKKHDDDWEAIREELRQYFADMDEEDPRLPLGRYTKVDARGPYRDDGDISWPGGGGPRYEVLHPVTGKPCKISSRGWVYPSLERFMEEVEAGRVVFGEDHTTVPAVRRDLFTSSTQVMRSVQFSYAQTAAQHFDAIFDGNRVFDNPKHYIDLATLVEYLTDTDDIVLDFFAGTCSLAHAVILVNNNDAQSQRKYICVQLPEPVTDKTKMGRNALSLELTDIFQIGLERLRRVLNNLPAGAEKRARQEDKGFRVFRLSASNFKTWDATVATTPTALEEQLALFSDHLREGRTDADILFEVLLKYGLPLTARLTLLKVNGQIVHAVQGNRLLVYLAKLITLDTIRGMAQLQPEAIICLDVAFDGNDQLKTNAVEELKMHGIEFRTL